jgi:hypothetical protein
MNFSTRLAALTAVSAIILTVPEIADAQDCPTAKSAASGYTIERDGGSKTDVLFGDGPTVRTIMRFDGKALLETTQFQGLFELDRLDRGRRAVFKPKSDLAPLFPLKQGQTVKVEFDVEGEGRPPTAAVQISVNGTDELYIGVCKYSVLKIDRRESRGGAPLLLRDTDYYSPELKLIIAKEYRHGEQRNMVKYDRIYPLKP